MGLVTLSSLLISVACLGWLGYARGIQEEIYNGWTARKGQFPYMVSVISIYQAYTAYCGGSLISHSWVATAAHCVERETKPLYITLVMGTIDIKNMTGAVQINSSEIIPHPEYNKPVDVNNDIALIRLSQPAPRNNPYIKVIELPRKRQANPRTFNNYPVYSSGWGSVNDIHGSDILQYTLQSIIDFDKCRSYIKKARNLPLTDGMICANRDTILGVTGTCSGDSGGPVTTLGWWPVLVGIISWGLGPCNTTTPDVLVNVAHYLTWINNVTGIPIR